MAADHIASLYQTLRRVFGKKDLPPGFWDYDQLWGTNEATLGEVELALVDFLRSESLLDGADVQATAANVDLRAPQAFAAYGAHGLPMPCHGRAMPPDALAFYLEYHYFWKDGLWGIYLKVEGVIWLAQYLVFNTGLSVEIAVQAASRFLYRHELWHHNVECFAARLEVVQRKPLYKTGFESLYRRTAGTNSWFEEALANAYAFRETLKSFSVVDRRSVKSALETYIRIPSRLQQGA